MEQDFQVNFDQGFSPSALPKPPTATPIDLPDYLRQWVHQVIPQPSLNVVRLALPYTVFQGGSTTKDVDLFTLPNYCEIVSCWMNVLTAFDGPATVTMSVGPDGTETTLLTAQNVKTTGLKKAIGTDLTTNRAIYSTTAKTTIQARCTAATNTSNLSAGQIEFGFTYTDYYNAR